MRFTIRHFFSVPEAKAFRSQTQEPGESSSRMDDNKLGVGSLQDIKERAEESDLQPSRPALAETVSRKSSEHKDPYSSDSLTDMENTAWPEWDQTDYNWENYGGYPGYAYYPPESSGYAGWGPRSRYYPYGYPYPEQPGEELLYRKGCSLSGSNIITDCTKEYKYHFAFLAGTVVKVKIDGPATLIWPKIKEPENIPASIMGNLVKQDGELYLKPGLTEEETYYTNKWVKEHRYLEHNKYPPNIIIKPDENAEYGSIVTITVFAKLVQNNGMAFDGWCQFKATLACGCRDAIPNIYATGGVTTMGRSDSLSMWVNSLDFPDIYAVSPFVWSIDASSGGTGFSLSKAETNEEYEVNVLSTNAEADGTVTIKVVDNCDVENTYDVTWDCCASAPGDPTISGTTDEVRQGSSITLASTKTCGPYVWEIDQTVDADGSGITVVGSGTSATVSANGAACGGAVVTVTDACGASGEYRVRCPDSGDWGASIETCFAEPYSTYTCARAACGGANSDLIVGDEKWVLQISAQCSYYPGTRTWDDNIGVGGNPAVYPPPCGSPDECSSGSDSCNVPPPTPCNCMSTKYIYYKWECP